MKKSSKIIFVLSLTSSILIFMGNNVPLILSTGFQWNVENWKIYMTEDSITMNLWHETWIVNDWFFYLSISSGIFVLIGAIILTKYPQSDLLGSILILIFSISGLFGLGISFLGGMLGIIGATYALSERRRRVNNTNIPL